MRQCSRSALTTILFNIARHSTSFTKTHNMQTVSTRYVPTDEEETEIELPLVELTELEMKALPKTFTRSLARESCLSTKERQQLTQMIFDTHYAANGKGKEDRAMWYQSSLELQWLEEWAFEQGWKEKDEIRRNVKKAVLQRVDLHKPLAYIIGHQPFYGCHIRCSPPLLCPRPETEMWTHWFVRNHLDVATEKTKKATTTTTTTTTATNVSLPPLRVLDMCCGTGCVGIAIAKHVSQAEIVAVDILDEAVKASEENAKINGIDSSRYKVIKSDMFKTFLEPDSVLYNSDNGEEKCKAEKGEVNKTQKKPILSKSYLGSFDIIVSNPPYVLPEQYVDLPPGIKLWESKIALVGDPQREQQQYLYFQELCELGAAALKAKRRRPAAFAEVPNFVMEVGLQAECVASLMERSGLWEDVQLHLDYAQQPRWISARSIH
ncbi:methyltransferase [Trypanosoma theileri]|uniref:Methyltransferase n=1 Tax=Trypanosoma theileri TaxID=67003 RepID=A0A1X0P0C0_9TRYP|nr:methyltransferase [Trypanosoma theileri]ORC90387.1 methyltransferase [Trypanosoma theileri]